MSDKSKNDLEFLSHGINTYNGTVALTIGGTVVPGTIASTISGEIKGISMGMGTMTGTGTMYLRLVDALGGTIADGTQAESGTSYFGTAVPINETMNWVVEPAGTQVENANFLYKVHYRG